MDKRIRVLLVDDRLEFLEAARAWLENDPATHVVGTARNGREAIDAVARLAPDLVLMDAFMPLMDGFAATAAIKSGPRAPIVILLSVHAGEAMEAKAGAAGADGFVPKDEFASRLPGLLRRFFGEVVSPGS